MLTKIMSYDVQIVPGEKKVKIGCKTLTTKRFRFLIDIFEQNSKLKVCDECIVTAAFSRNARRDILSLGRETADKTSACNNYAWKPTKREIQEAKKLCDLIDSRSSKKK